MRKKQKRTVFLKMCYNYAELRLFLCKQYTHKYTHKSDNQTNKQQTNTLLSPDTIQCTRGQNIKQIHSS
jgi:hypothetical protein